MTRVNTWVCVTLALCFVSPGLGQQSPATPANSGVPSLVNFSGTLVDVNGKPLTGVVGATFLLYKDEQGGAPVWLETQNVTPDENGRYTVTLGATTSRGLPVDVFANGEARWLAVQVVGQAEQARVLLVAVPYALKASDAETVGGLPPSAFLLASRTIDGSNVGSANQSSSATSTSNPLSNSSNVTTTGGTVNALPLWTTATNIQSSVVTQTGSGSSARIGINTASPAATLDVKGGTNLEGLLDLPSTGTATSSGGKNSQAQDFVASSFNSSTKTAVNQTFQWRAEPTGNNTSSPTGTLNLLFGSGSSSPTETGLKISNKGLLTFANGQTFPGTGSITGVTAGTDLTGGGTKGNVTLNLNTSALQTQNDARYAQLAANNTFTGNQSVLGNIVINNGLFGNTASFTGNTFKTDIVDIVQSGLASGLSVSNVATCASCSGNAVAGFSSQNNASAVLGETTAASGLGIGLNGFSASSGGIGTLGTGELISKTAQGIQGCCPVGVWGDSGASGSGATGVIATADDAKALFVENNSPTGFPTAFFLNNQSSAHNLGVLQAEGRFGFCGTDTDGNLTCTGNISKAGGSFKIDHPLDPAHKYLYHSFVESPDMKNIYDGVVVLDGNGEALVPLPEWFEALNRDFRYQLTCIGGYAPVYIADEVARNHFKIAGGEPGLKVSWQVTGIRQDVWANEHRIPVELEKAGTEKGHYLHPELYGQPKEKGIGWARHEEMWQQMKSRHEKPVQSISR